MEEPLSLDASVGLENKRVFLFCFVFSDSYFSEEGSLPGTASPALGT